MSSPRRSSLPALLLAALLATLPACAHMVIHDVNVSGDRWTLMIDGFTDGPDGFSVSGGGHGTYYTPEEGERFFRVRINLRNDAAEERSFNFDRCDLDDGDKTRVAGLVARAPITFEADRVTTVAPRETIGRWLVFSYPKDRSPTRLSCAPMVIRLPPIPPR